jgi:hypothetical protein
LPDSSYPTFHIELLEEWNEDNRWDIIKSTDHDHGNGIVTYVQDAIMMGQSHLSEGDEKWYPIEHDYIVAIYEEEQLCRLVVITRATHYVGGAATQVLYDRPLSRYAIDIHAHKPRDPNAYQDRP